MIRVKINIKNAVPPKIKESYLIEKINSQLTAYQRDILEESLNKKSGGLALPMGSGKTILSLLISLIQNNELREKGVENPRTLIIVAKSLIITWKDEIKKFFGEDLKYEILHQEYIKNLDVWKPETSIVITTPEMISKIYTLNDIEDKFIFSERPEQWGPAIKNYYIPNNPYLNRQNGGGILYSIKWGTIIIDEAPSYFNLQSARCKGLCALSGYNRWLLSGTILQEPKPENVFACFLMINKENTPRNYPDFYYYLRNDFPGMNHILVKREKNIDFQPPGINKKIISHNLSEVETKIYTNVKNILGILRTQLNTFKKNGDVENIRKFSSYILAMISHLRQCLICPLIPITTVAIDVADLEVRSELSEIFLKCINDIGIDNWLNDVNSLYSSRIHSVIDTINLHQSQKILVFSCYRTVLDVIKIYLPANRPHFIISGNHTINKRIGIIEDFKNSTNGVLLLTYDIGSSGLNLQFCDTALLVDFWWNSSKTDQAIARILRTGQQSESINLYYFTSNTGMENAIFNLHRSKLDMANEIFTGPLTSQINPLKINELLNIINTEDNITILNTIIN